MPAWRSAPPWFGPRGKTPGGAFRPPSIGAFATPGVPFLDQIPAFAALWPNARLVAQMAIGATPFTDLTNPSVWTDVTSDVQYLDTDTNAINIGSIGRPDAVTGAQPASCSFVLDNRQSRYSDGPQSPNYPNIVQNIPTRIGVTLSGSLNTIYWRFWGTAWSMNPSFDKTGKYAVVTVQAAGRIRQLQQGNIPLKSAMTRAVAGLPASATPIAYWPCEDGPNTIQAISPITGVDPLDIEFGGVTFAAGAGADGSDVQPNFDSINNFLAGDIPYPANPAPIPYFRLQGFFKTSFLESGPSVTGAGFSMSVSTAANDAVYIINVWDSANGGVTVQALNQASGDLLSGGLITNVTADDAAWHELRLDATQSGGNVIFQAYLDGVLIGSKTTSIAHTLMPLQSINVTGGAGKPSAGHFLIWYTSISTATFNTVDAMRGHAGEGMVDRAIRLCRENNLPIEIFGSSTTTMGPQKVDTLINLLRECANADLGILGDGRGPGVYIVTRSSRYNQSTTVALDVSAVADSLDPQKDDQRVKNKYRVTRKGGSTATFEQITGRLGTGSIQTYEAEPDGGDINVSSDDVLYNIAAFLTKLGTVEGYRYPTVAIDWRRPEAVAQAANWLTMLPGNRFAIQNIGSYVTQLPPEDIDLLAEGWSEQLSRFMWRTSPVNCSPAQPWDIVTLGPGAGVPFILDMSGQTLAQDLSPGDVTLILNTASGIPLFTTTAQFPADFPRLLNVGGWKINCTGASGASSPQILNITAAPNTRIVPAGTAVTVWHPPVLGL